MVYIDGNNRENCSVGVTQDGETNENSQNSLHHETEAEQTSEQGPLSQRYTEPSVQAVMTANLPTLQEYWDEDFSNVTSVQHGINSLSFNTLAANIDFAVAHIQKSARPIRKSSNGLDHSRWTKQEAKRSQEQVNVRGNITRRRSHNVYKS